jgi:spore maturation protein CgeB
MPGEERAAPDVVVLGPDHPDSFAENISVAFNELGVSATVIDPGRRYARPGTFARYSRSRRYLTEAAKRSSTARAVLIDRPVEQALSEVEPTLVISTFGHFSPEQLDRWRVRTPGATWVLWYPDALSNLGAQTAFTAGYDHLFFKDPYLVDLLAARTALPVHYLPQACNPRRHRSEEPASPAEAERYRCAVTIAGNMYPYRMLLLRQLADDVDLKLYGNPPSGDDRLFQSYTGRYVTGREKALAFRGAAIVLNTMHYAEIRGVNLRLFEATGCGGFVLTHASPGLADYFVDGEEVVAFNTGAELRDAVAHYLREPDARRSIAAAGQARAHRDHSYARRFERMLSVCHKTDLLPVAAGAT